MDFLYRYFYYMQLLNVDNSSMYGIQNLNARLMFLNKINRVLGVLWHTVHLPRTSVRNKAIVALPRTLPKALNTTLFAHIDKSIKADDIEHMFVLTV